MCVPVMGEAEVEGDDEVVEETEDRRVVTGFVTVQKTQQHVLQTVAEPDQKNDRVSVFHQTPVADEAEVEDDDEVVEAQEVAVR